MDIDRVQCNRQVRSQSLCALPESNRLISILRGNRSSALVTTALILMLPFFAVIGCGSSNDPVGPSANAGPAGTGNTSNGSMNTAGKAGAPTTGGAPVGGSSSLGGNAFGGSTSSGGSSSNLGGAQAAGGAAGSTSGVGGANVATGGRATGGSATGAAGSAAGPVDYGAKGPFEIVVEQNVGESFRNDVSDDTETCKEIMAKLLGSQVPDSLIHYPTGMDWQLYTLFRPKNLEAGKKYPVITWGDGTCSNPQTFSKILEHLASHGFLVIASNYRQVGDGKVMLRAVEFILSENENAQSALYGKVDTKMIGATGHSQGSMATATVGADKRIIATVPIQGANAAAVKAIKGPTFLIAGEKDTTVAPAGIESAFNAATVPALYGLALGADHTMPPVNPTVILGPITAWFKIHLANDGSARDVFYGDACTLCKDPLWTIKRKNL